MVAEHAEHWTQFFEDEFEKESDRASVILSAAMLDAGLEGLIKAFLVPTTSPEDNLLEGSYAPISSFSAKIDLAHRLSLISTKFCRDLHIIRRIRNEFAHNITGCSFDNAVVRNRIIELTRSSGLAEREPKMRKQFLEGTKGDFQMAVSWMLYHLWRYPPHIHPLEEAQLEFGYVGKSDKEEKSNV